MLLLTWHGTILRVEQAANRLSQAALVPVRAAGRDYVLEVPDGPLALPLALDGRLTLVAGPRPGTVHVTRGKHFLCAEPGATVPGFDREWAGKWETFLPVAEAEVAALRALVGGAFVADDDAPRFAVEPGFVLTAGPLRLDLTVARPTVDTDGTLLVPLPEGDWRLVPAATAPAPGEIELRRAPPASWPEAPSEEAFRSAPGMAFTLPQSREFYFPPLMAGPLADRDWTLESAQNGPPPLGPQTCRLRVLHGENAFVLLDRCIEGMVVGGQGVESEAGYLDNLPAMLPPHFAREGSAVFLATSALQAAPVLRGPHAVFYGGNLVNHFHWMIDAIVPLCVMAPLLPRETTLLLPATLGAMPGAKLDVLDAFGFDTMQRVEIDAPVCMVQDLYRPEPCFLPQIPAAALLVARARAFAQLPDSGVAGQRIFIRPEGPRGIVNMPAMELFAKNHKLEIVSLAGMVFAEQIKLFRAASLVIGVHGEEMANILFCAPGTAVLELSPACQYRPQFNILSGKLDLVHAVLPCPTLDKGFDTALKVPLPRLRILLDMLQIRAGQLDDAA